MDSLRSCLIARKEQLDHKNTKINPLVASILNDLNTIFKNVINDEEKIKLESNITSIFKEVYYKTWIINKIPKEEILPHPSSYGKFLNEKTKPQGIRTPILIYCGLASEFGASLLNKLDINFDLLNQEGQIAYNRIEKYLKPPPMEGIENEEDDLKSLMKIVKDNVYGNSEVIVNEFEKTQENIKNIREAIVSKEDFENNLNQILEKISSNLNANIYKTTNVSNNIMVNNTYITQINHSLKQINLFLEEERGKLKEIPEKETINVYDIPKITKLSFILFIWRKIKLLFGFKNWIYALKGNEIPLDLRGEDIYENFTKHYIPAYFQLNVSIYDGKSSNTLNPKTNKLDNILSYLIRHLLKIELLPNEKKSKFYFILAGSGIGKTSLLLKLYLEARIQKTEWDNVYFLPFSKWRHINFLDEQDKYNSVLFLDSMDENFKLNNKESIKNIIYELKLATKNFGKVIITSRDLFFRDKGFIEFFTNNVGDEEYSDYKIISLSPFTPEQVQKYLEKKFSNTIEINKAKNVVKIIGDSSHRQLLISKIDWLINAENDEGFMEEVKEFYLFDKMLKNWLKKEKYKFKNLETKKRLQNEAALDLKNTYDFCEILAEQIRKKVTNLTFNNIVNLVDIKHIKKSKLLINRSFLLLDAKNNYRFAHNSIYEFFLAKKAIKDIGFDKKYFYRRNPITKGVDEFSRKLYKQGVAMKFNDLKNNPLSKYIFYTKKIKEIYQYGQDIRFEPFFRVENLKGKQKQLPYIKRRWTPISKLIIDEFNEIIGVKFICNNGIDIISESIDQKEIRLRLRQECFDIFDTLRRYLRKPCSVDSSEITHSRGYIFSGFSFNLREANYKNKTLILNNRGYEDRPITINFRGVKVNELDFELGGDPLTLNLIFDYTDYLFKFLFEKNTLHRHYFWKIPENIYIFLSHKDLENGNLLDVDRIRVLSKKRGFESVFFTEDKVLDEYEILRCFPDVQVNKLTTTSIDYYQKARSYVNYIDNGVTIKQGFNKSFETTVFSKYPNTFPKFFEELELKNPIGHKVSSRISFKNSIDKKVSINIFKDNSRKEKDLLDKEVLNCNYSFSQLFNLKGEKIISYEQDFIALKLRINRFKYTKHLILGRRQNVFQFDKLKKLEIESLYIENVGKEEFKINDISLINLKRLGLNITNTEEIRLINLMNLEKINKLDEFSIVSQKNDNNIQGLINVFSHHQLKNLVLDFNINNINLITSSVVNSNLEKLTIQLDLFSRVIKKVTFKNLNYLELKKIDLSSEENIIIPILEKILIYSEIKELVLTFLNVDSNNKILIVKEALILIEKYNVSKLVISIRYKRINNPNIDQFASLLKKLNQPIKTLNLKLKVVLGINEFGEGTEALVFDFKDIKKDLLNIDYNVNESHRIDYQFLNLFYSTMINYPIKNIFVKEQKLEDILKKNKVINFHNQSYEKMDFNYLESVFFNSKGDTLLNSKNSFFVDFAQNKHIRFINFIFTGGTFFKKYSNFKFLLNTTKISLSSINDYVLFDIGLTSYDPNFKGIVCAPSYRKEREMFASNLKEIELLTHYMLIEEINEIPKYKLLIEEYGIILTINPKELKVINLEKGLFETEVIEV